MFIGLMSGTSVDAVDGVLAAFEGGTPSAPARTLAFASRSMPPELRQTLLDLQSSGLDELHRASLATVSLTDLYAEVARELLEWAGGGQVLALGAHGQTVRHRPELGYTLQLIDGARLAERTGCTVVVDFRTGDLAAGGQGAPLVPAFHAQAFGTASLRRAIVNIGGMANVSLLPKGQGVVQGHDTGPGNALMDLWCEQHLGRPYDADGQWAAQGQIHEGLLARLLDDAYFEKPAPKSTGRDHFNAAWLDARCACIRQALRPEDVQATLAEVTAITIARACATLGAEETWVCGGGARNSHLMQRLALQLVPTPVASVASLGIDPMAVEALAFAWLARERLAGRPGNLPVVTGARGSRVLGAVYAPF